MVCLTFTSVQIDIRLKNYTNCIDKRFGCGYSGREYSLTNAR